jgi:hypothetical protein
VLERELHQGIADLAHMYGYRVAWFRPCKDSKRGWRTAVGGDGKGWPDLTLVNVRKRRVLFRELKVGGNEPSDEQSQWIADLTAAGQDAGVWTDEDFPDGIVEELRR